MCGIAGIINFDDNIVDSATLAKMNNSLTHRGPNESGSFIDKNIGLTHNRLSIIDLKNGQQPMLNNDKTVCISFNGEIYNYCELRSKLQDKGYTFKTNSDTEVLLYLFQEYGKDCLQYINGMFAFAGYNKNTNKVLIARDRMGQKPLVYYESNKFFAFASELQALKQHSKIPKELNYQSIHNYLSLQYIPAPDTIYCDVRKLLPAHYIEIDLLTKKSKINKYWSLDYSKKTIIPFNEAKEELYQILSNSVKQRMMSDVPYGAFLSGGIDSSIVTGLMSDISGEEIKSFTIGFEEDKYDERKYANSAVNAINQNTKGSVKSFQKVVKLNNFDLIKKLITHYGEPYCDASMLPTLLLSEFTKQKVTVALSGDGADELFCGYNRYSVMKYAKNFDKIPLVIRKNIFNALSKVLPNKTDERTFFGKLQRILKVLSVSEQKRYLSIINRFHEKDKYSVYGDAIKDFNFSPTIKYMNNLFSETTSINYTEKVSEVDVHSYLYNDILCKVDIASMATSLEVRSPFMDYKVAEFAASLPMSYKLNGKNQKHILKESFKNFLPKNILHRKKMGFGVPIAQWIREDWSDLLKENLLEGQCVAKNIYNKQSIENMIKIHNSKQGDFSYRLWALLILELFLQGEL